MQTSVQGLAPGGRHCEEVRGLALSEEVCDARALVLLCGS